MAQDMNNPLHTQHYALRQFTVSHSNNKKGKIIIQIYNMKNCLINYHKMCGMEMVRRKCSTVIWSWRLKSLGGRLFEYNSKRPINKASLALKLDGLYAAFESN